MPPVHGAQKFVERNRPPRVQIAVDEELPDGARVKVKLPFVAGVMADLSGKWADPEEVPEEHKSARGDLVDRKFLEIDQENFNDRMKAIRPTVSFNVPNALTGEGQIPVNLSFESMDDFAPDKIASRLEPLKALFEARQALAYLKDMASNKAAMEKTLQRLIANPDLAKALVDAAKLPKS